MECGVTRARQTDFQRYAYGNSECDTRGAVVAEATGDHTIRPRLELRHYNACTKVYLGGAEVRLVSTDRQANTQLPRSTHPVSSLLTG
jgi:hypothetical protein